MNIAKLSLLVMASALVSGCGYSSSASFRDMSAAYREVVESYSNDNILINVVRASKRMPVSFLDIPSIVGSGNVSSGVGIGANVSSRAPGSIPGFFSADPVNGLSSYAPNASLSVSGGFTFTQSSLDNAMFMKPFLSEIQPDIVRYLSNNQVAPNSVLFTLVVDSIEVISSSKDVLYKFSNDPRLPDYDKFQVAMYLMVAAGLTTEQVPTKLPVSPPFGVDVLKQNLGQLTGVLPAGVIVEAVPKTSPQQYQLVRIAPVVRLCLNRSDSETIFKKMLDESIYCAQQVKTRGPTKEALELAKLIDADSLKEKVSIAITLRSTRNVFDFLGTVVSMQNAENPIFVSLIDPSQVESSPGKTIADLKSTPLFIVNKNKSTGRAITTVKYDGDTYSIPADTKGYTNDVIVLLSQLLTLNKIAGSIPPSPSVLVR